MFPTKSLRIYVLNVRVVIIKQVDMMERTSIVRIDEAILNSTNGFLKSLEEVRKIEDELVVLVVPNRRGFIDATLNYVYGIDEGKQFEKMFEKFYEIGKIAGNCDLDLYIDFEHICIIKRIKEIQQKRGSVKKSRKNENLSEINMLLTAGNRINGRIVEKILQNYGDRVEFINYFDNCITDITESQPHFPLHVEKNPRFARVNYKNSRLHSKRLETYAKSADIKYIIVPGLCGLDESKSIRPVIKSLGRGGSDTAALALLYAFDADSLWFAGERNGIKTAVFNGSYTQTVKDIDLEEFRLCGDFEAGIRTSNVMEPLKMIKKEVDKYSADGKEYPKIYIAHAYNLQGPKTKVIFEETEYKKPVKFIADAHGVMYSIYGDRNSLERELNEKGVSWFSPGSGPYRMKLGLFPRGQRLGSETLENYKKKYELGISSEPQEVSVIGVIGSGMKNRRGVVLQIGDALRSIGISHTYTLGDSGEGVIVARKDGSQAVQNLYHQFFTGARR